MELFKNLHLKCNRKQIIITLLLNITATVILLPLHRVGFSDVNIVVVYILSVLITSSFTEGYTYGIIASVISMLSFNFFYTDPTFTFKVYNKGYIITFIIMLMSSIITSTLASKLIRSRELADKQENQSRILYSIASSLAKTSEPPEVATVSARCLSNLFECEVICLIVNAKDTILHKFIAEKSCSQITDQTNVTDKLDYYLTAYSTYPIKIRDTIISYLCLPKDLDQMSPDRKFLLDSIIIQMAIAMERVYLIRDKEAAKSESERERFKSNLLRAISHDIRTPLTRITGAAQMLYHNLEENENIKLVQGIYEDSSWLTRLVENILSLTRIQEGKMTIHIQQEAVEEIIAGAINQASKHSPHHKILITVPEEVLFVPMDGKLIEQVLINLIINAIEHTTPDNEISVSVKVENDKVWFEVKDNGVGINETDLLKIFEMFSLSNSNRTDGKQGVGLGLTICKAIVNFHGGEIFASNNSEGGSTFRFYLKKKMSDI